MFSQKGQLFVKSICLIHAFYLLANVSKQSVTSSETHSFGPSSSCSVIWGRGVEGVLVTGSISFSSLFESWSFGIFQGLISVSCVLGTKYFSVFFRTFEVVNFNLGTHWGSMVLNTFLETILSSHYYISQF